MGPGGLGPPNLAQAPKFLDTVVLLLVELIGSIVISLKFRLAVVASQMMRGQQARFQRGVTEVEPLPPVKSKTCSRMHQNALFRRRKCQNFSGNGAQPRPQAPPPLGRGIPPPQTLPPSTLSAPPFECRRHSTPQTTFLHTDLGASPPPQIFFLEPPLTVTRLICTNCINREFS